MSSMKSISVQGRPVMSSYPNTGGADASARMSARMGSSYSRLRSRRTMARVRPARLAAASEEKRKKPTDSP